MEFNWITERLAVGARVHGQAEAEELKRLGFTHVMNCAIEENACWVGLQCANYPIADDMSRHGADWLQTGAQWVIGNMANLENRFYIGCRYGVHRSALMAAGVLVGLGATPDEAMRRIIEKRPVCGFPRNHQLTLLDFHSLHSRPK